MDFIGMVQSYLPNAKPTDDLIKLVALVQPDLHWRDPFLRRMIRKKLESNFLAYVCYYIRISRRWLCAFNYLSYILLLT